MSATFLGIYGYFLSSLFFISVCAFFDKKWPIESRKDLAILTLAGGIALCLLPITCIPGISDETFSFQESVEYWVYEFPWEQES